jgi:hypothetical protein
MSEQFTIYKIEGLRKPWTVQDNSTPEQEDATLYHFTSKAKAEAFRKMLESEKAARISKLSQV